jgi:hypothetical protein
MKCINGRLAAKKLPVMVNKIITKLGMCVSTFSLPVCLKKCLDLMRVSGRFHIAINILKLRGKDNIILILDDHIV